MPNMRQGLALAKLLMESGGLKRAEPRRVHGHQLQRAGAQVQRDIKAGQRAEVELEARC